MFLSCKSSVCYVLAVFHHIVKSDNPPSYAWYLALRVSRTISDIVPKGPIGSICILCSIGNSFTYVVTMLQLPSLDLFLKSISFWQPGLSRKRQATNLVF